MIVERNNLLKSLGLAECARALSLGGGDSDERVADATTIV
jgi:hypothetical protein